MPQAPNQDLTAFVERMGGDRALRVEESLGQGFVRLRVAEAERRQAAHDIRCSEDVVIEMLRNARDAGARRVFVATSREGSLRQTVMLDDGCGIPKELWNTVFDARVTSKLESVHMDRWGVHGRGMALFSIRENAKVAEVVDSVVDGGSTIRVVTDTERLPEKSDQSSWPSVGRADDGTRVIERGPHNIVRTCCEFALEERGRCEVYLGSAAEIAATIRSKVRSSHSASDLLFVDDLATLPVLERFRLASDARELRQVAAGCGLEMSERTAHRIVAGRIKPMRSVLARLEHAATPRERRTVDLGVDRRGLHIGKDDAEEFLRMMERDFAYLSDRYYLSLGTEPRLRVSGRRITVTFEVDSED